MNPSQSLAAVRMMMPVPRTAAANSYNNQTLDAAASATANSRLASNLYSNLLQPVVGAVREVGNDSKPVTLESFSDNRP